MKCVTFEEPRNWVIKVEYYGYLTFTPKGFSITREKTQAFAFRSRARAVKVRGLWLLKAAIKGERWIGVIIEPVKPPA